MKKIVYFLFFIATFQTACKKNTTPPDLQPTIVDPANPATDLPTGAKDGVSFINNGTSALVTLYAPGKTSVSVIGDFNNWQSSATPMKKANDGNTWWVQIDNLNANTEYAYQFLVNESF